jgi:putative transport protein
MGIALGVLAGLQPLSIPGLAVPVQLGIAGGTLVVAILLSRLGRIGRLVWYMPANANLAFRELGITLFLACVGLKAGAQFFAMVFSASGLVWLLAAAGVTLLPLLAVGCFARAGLKLNYMAICGLLSGSMTDPPALAFASAISKSDAPSVAYATVYPLTMLLRIVAAQSLALLLCR